MKEFLVEWSIPIEADSAEDAALQAKGILQDPENIAWVFTVKGDKDELRSVIDVEYDKPYTIRIG